MYIVGLLGDDFNESHMMGRDVDFAELEPQQGFLLANVYDAHIDFDPYITGRYRPHLLIQAQVVGSRINPELSSGFDGFLYRDVDKENIEVRYDFTDDQLAALVTKGLYRPDFKIPADLLGAQLEIPVEVSGRIYDLNGVLVGIPAYDRSGVYQMDVLTSGYELTGLFAEQGMSYMGHAEYEANRQSEAENVLTFDDSIYQGDLDSFVDALSYLTFDDVVAEDEREDVEEDVQEVVEEAEVVEEVETEVYDNSEADIESVEDKNIESMSSIIGSRTIAGNDQIDLTEPEPIQAPVVEEIKLEAESEDPVAEEPTSEDDEYITYKEADSEEDEAALRRRYTKMRIAQEVHDIDEARDYALREIERVGIKASEVSDADLGLGD